jgi:hypothetical protein
MGSAVLRVVLGAGGREYHPARNAHRCPRVRRQTVLFTANVVPKVWPGTLERVLVDPSLDTLEVL